MMTKITESKKANQDRRTKEILDELYVNYLGNIYRNTKKKMEQGSGHEVNRHSNDPDYDELTVRFLDEALALCSEETREFIRKEFLEESPCNWYEQEYSKWRYNRLKVKAVRQFLDCLAG